MLISLMNNLQVVPRTGSYSEIGNLARSPKPFVPTRGSYSDRRALIPGFEMFVPCTRELFSLFHKNELKFLVCPPCGELFRLMKTKFSKARSLFPVRESYSKVCDKIGGNGSVCPPYGGVIPKAKLKA